MRPVRFGGLLLATGAAVGVAAVVGLVIGFEPSRLPAALLDIAVYKLTFAAAAGLLAAGAIVRRYSDRSPSDRATSSSDVANSAPDMPRLPEGGVADFSQKREEPADARVPKHR